MANTSPLFTPPMPPTQHQPAARHPLRARLRLVRSAARPARADDGDLKLFAVSFTAFFICFYTMIA